MAAALNSIRPNSALFLKADLNLSENFALLAKQVYQHWQRLDALVNNASLFYATPWNELTAEALNELFITNVQAPVLLSKACAPYLKERQGCIINITDIHASHPLKNHSAYCISKAALAMATQVLAKELAPEIRVNAIAPGAVVWPEAENELSETQQQKIIDGTLLKRHGTPLDIAKAVYFLIQEAPYVTGHTLSVDGGRYI